MSAVLPITEDDSFIRAALQSAEIPALLLALSQATGDLLILRPDLRPDASDLLGAQGCLSEEQLAALAATFAEEAVVWKIRTREADGAEETLEANVVISAVGQLNRPSYSDIPGRDDFQGPCFHSARWQPDVDLQGQTVGVIGTGATAVQLIPVLAEQAGDVVIFQRTPPWLAPTPDYHDLVAEGLEWLLRHVPSYAEWYRFWLFCTCAEGLLPLVKVDPGWRQVGTAVSTDNELVRQGLVEYLEDQFGDRPDLLQKVVPDYPPAAKRMLRDNGIWAPTLKRENVRLVTDQIVRITADGVATDAGDYRLDALVLATGFQASHFLMPMTVKCSINYIMDSIRRLLADKRRTMECREDVFWAYNREIDDVNRNMAWGASDVHSWYKNELGRVSQNWPYTLRNYWQRTQEVSPSDFVFG